MGFLKLNEVLFTEGDEETADSLLADTDEPSTYENFNESDDYGWPSDEFDDFDDEPSEQTYASSPMAEDQIYANLDYNPADSDEEANESNSNMRYINQPEGNYSVPYTGSDPQVNEELAHRRLRNKSRNCFASLGILPPQPPSQQLPHHWHHRRSRSRYV